MALPSPASLRHVSCTLSRLMPSGCSLASVRKLSQQSGNEMVEQMVQFARTSCQRSFVLQGNSQQALDVLQTGLAHQEGVGRSRLQLAMAEVEASSSNWVQMCDIVHDILTDPTNVVRLLLQAAVSEHAGQIAYVRTNTPMPASAAKLQAEASAVCVRALLVQGHDQEAARLAQQATEDIPTWFAEAQQLDRHCAQVQALTSLAGTQHATGDASGAAVTCQTASAISEDTRAPAAVCSAAAKQEAALRLAQGSAHEAGSLYSRASLAGLKDLSEVDDAGLTPRSAAQELAADALLGSAQAAITQQAWPEAEEHISKALNIAEQAHDGSGKHPIVGVILGLLAHVYAQSKRITLAEGLHRQAVKLLQLNVASPEQASVIPVHSSLAAASAWRYSQLLTALPRRETEASNWRQYAQHQWSKGNAKPALQETLGSLQLLKGSASKGSGVVIDLTLRRALPCFKGTDAA